MVRPAELSVVALEQVMGIEPTRSAWEAEVLPLNYTCKWLSTVLLIHILSKSRGNVKIHPVFSLIGLHMKERNPSQFPRSSISFSSLCLTRWSALSMLLTWRPSICAIS